MKIYKVELNPSNPVEKIVKIPVCSSYGIQITWNYEQFPKFTGTDTDTENGYLTNHDGKIEENTSFTEINGQKIYTNLPIIENVGNTIVFYYGKYETFEENKVQNFGSIKVVGVDADDFDVDVGGGSSSIEGITYTDGNLTLSAENEITLIPYNQTGKKEINVKLGINGNYPMIYPENDYLMLSSNGTVIMGRDLATINAGSGPLNLKTQTGVNFCLGGNSLKMEQNSIFSRLSADALWLKGNNNTLVQGGNVTLGTTGDDGSINFDLNNCFKLGFGNKKSSGFQANVEIYYNEGDAKPYIKLCEGGTYGRTLDTPLYDALAGGSGSSGGYTTFCERDDEWDSSYTNVEIGQTDSSKVVYQMCLKAQNITVLGESSTIINSFGSTMEFARCGNYTGLYIGCVDPNGCGNYWGDNYDGSTLNINSDFVPILISNRDTGDPGRGQGIYLCTRYGDLKFCIDTDVGRGWKINGYKIDLERFLSEYGSYEG